MIIIVSSGVMAAARPSCSQWWLAWAPATSFHRVRGAARHWCVMRPTFPGDNLKIVPTSHPADLSQRQCQQETQHGSELKFTSSDHFLSIKFYDVLHVLCRHSVNLVPSLFSLALTANFCLGLKALQGVAARAQSVQPAWLSYSDRCIGMTRKYLHCLMIFWLYNYSAGWSWWWWW